jgi:hypothetical protein
MSNPISTKKSLYVRKNHCISTVHIEKVAARKMLGNRIADAAIYFLKVTIVAVCFSKCYAASFLNGQSAEAHLETV